MSDHIATCSMSGGPASWVFLLLPWAGTLAIGSVLAHCETRRYRLASCAWLLWLPGQTQRSLKLAIAESTTEKNLQALVFFAGYAAGSSVGFATTLAMYLLCQSPKDAAAISNSLMCPSSDVCEILSLSGCVTLFGCSHRGSIVCQDPWQVDEVRALVRSACRIKAVYVVYSDPFQRMTDSLRWLGLFMLRLTACVMWVRTNMLECVAKLSWLGCLRSCAACTQCLGSLRGFWPSWVRGCDRLCHCTIHVSFQDQHAYTCGLSQKY